MQALISDIHGNLEALEAVSSKISGLDIQCLGDVIGYGPDSVECIRRSAPWKRTVAGEFDLALIGNHSIHWQPTIKKLIDKLRLQCESSADAESLFQILGSYGPEYSSDGFLFFHGEPGKVAGWVFPEHIFDPKLLNKMVNSPEHVFVGGGSHLPGIFRQTRDKWEFIEPENEVPYELPPNEKTIVTIGSVGQPRDNDTRAAYAVLTPETITFHRVDYDIETTRSKINEDPDIDDMHGERLPSGR